jgi:hypothetical protein
LFVAIKIFMWLKNIPHYSAATADILFLNNY